MEKGRSPVKPPVEQRRAGQDDATGRSSAYFAKPKRKHRFFLSFKNRILISTLLVMIGGVVAIAAILQILVFPRLGGDPVIIANLKTIHLVASAVVVAISWGFIELISKKITRPLRELTKRADQISREAGKSLSPSLFSYVGLAQAASEEDSEETTGDEILQLKTSFYSMLAYLHASEAHLRESEAKYRFLFNDGPFPLFVLDADKMTILDVNARAEQEYQYRREELLGKSFLELGLTGGRKQTGNVLRSLAAKQSTLLPVIHQKRRDGSVFMTHIEARLSWFKERPAIIAAVWDVTEKLEHEAMMVQTATMVTLGEMATGIAHELNQPLNVIKICSEFLLKSHRKGRAIAEEELLKTADELGKNVDRAALIIGHLRQFGRKAEATMAPMNINVAVRGAFTLLGTQLKKTGIQCELNLDENLPQIMGDTNRIEQVFINLIVNARDAMVQHEKDTGETTEKILTIESFVQKNRVVVTVSDTGPGVPPELAARIFEPFFTTKKVGEGTGVGLSVSYSIIKEHQGTIEVDGQEEIGATFRLTFPALNEHLETQHEESPSC